MSAPYATIHDLPKFEKRTADVRAPWFKDQPATKNVRGQDPVPYVTCNSKSAPYATADNVPKPAEPSSPAPVRSPSKGQERKASAPYGTSNDVILPRKQANLATVHQAPWDRSDRKLDQQPSQATASKVQQASASKVHQAPYDRSDRKVENHPSQANASKVHQAPWERNDVHHKPRFTRGEDAPHHTSSIAPYATTEAKRG